VITFLRGKVFTVGIGFVDVDVHGVGYRVLVSDRWADRVTKMDDIFVYTYHYVREDLVQLLGFETVDERDWFELLLGVSGIGPKGAMQIVSGGRYDDFASAVVDEDTGYLSKLPGVGKKTAQRLVLELRDKILTRWNPVTSRHVSHAGARRNRPQSVEADVLEALESLGYPERQVADQVRAVIEEHPDFAMEDVLRMCLQRLAK
jgi:holliday junction DNA helicase RuvA